ncbi:MAG: hypothetical protein EOL88_02520 [Bacteroidia bacterium]|nr:hypothetical protein [Bacteroidia bacterium]
MEVTLRIKLEFESWFENERQPKTKKEWEDFFNNNLEFSSSLLGADHGKYQDMIAINSYSIECTDIIDKQ